MFFVYLFIELVALIQRNSALRNEALAYLISELVTWRRPLSTTVAEKEKNLGRNLK